MQKQKNIKQYLNYILIGGIPFVDNIAKKTYVKTKSNITNDNTKQINKIEDDKEIEEYLELLKEFGNEV